MVDNQDPAANQNLIVTFSIPDSIKHLLDEDNFRIKCRKKVYILYNISIFSPCLSYNYVIILLVLLVA